MPRNIMKFQQSVMPLSMNNKKIRKYYVSNAIYEDLSQPPINSTQIVRDLLRVKNNLSHVNNVLRDVHRRSVETNWNLRKLSKRIVALEKDVGFWYDSLFITTVLSIVFWFRFMWLFKWLVQPVNN